MARLGVGGGVRWDGVGDGEESEHIQTPREEKSENEWCKEH